MLIRTNITQRTVKTAAVFTTLLTVYFFGALIIPNCVLANTEPTPVWTVEALILMPLGFYMMWERGAARSGIMIWLAFPVISRARSRSCCCTLRQLDHRHGHFTNMVTTNPGEAGDC